MPSSEARIQTPKAGRYLAQLCQHAGVISGRTGRHPHAGGGPAGAHPHLRHVEQSDREATLDFGRARCILRAEPGALTLRVEADDTASLRQIETLIAADIERFGNREEVTVTWDSRDDDDGSGPD